MSGLLRGLVTRGGSGPTLVAEGVWRVQGEPGRLNVYLIEDGDGLVQFDAGGRSMVEQLRAAIAEIGRPLHRIVLGHGHTDHRGSAPFMGVPVACHADEVIDAHGSGGFRYWPAGLSPLPQPRRFLHREVLHPRFWDGGPVSIAETVAEGDDVAGFRVVHLPGHAPGQIALVRERDGLALTTDVFYTIDGWGRDSEPHVPDDVWNLDTEQARTAVARLAELAPAQAWPGHGDPLTDAVADRLRAAVSAEH